jgi:hypothetical protein
MAKLIVGRFDNIVDATHALDALPAEGFALREYGLFYVGPPGQHAIYPIGGDAYSDEGAKDPARARRRGPLRRRPRSRRGDRGRARSRGRAALPRGRRYIGSFSGRSRRRSRATDRPRRASGRAARRTAHRDLRRPTAPSRARSNLKRSARRMSRAEGVVRRQLERLRSARAGELVDTGQAR